MGTSVLLQFLLFLLPLLPLKGEAGQPGERDVANQVLVSEDLASQLVGLVRLEWAGSLDVGIWLMEVNVAGGAERDLGGLVCRSGWVGLAAEVLK